MDAIEPLHSEDGPDFDDAGSAFGDSAPRPIGSGLMIQPTGLAVLRTMGLAEATIAAGARIDRLIG